MTRNQTEVTKHLQALEAEECEAGSLVLLGVLGHSSDQKGFLGRQVWCG